VIEERAPGSFIEASLELWDCARKRGMDRSRLCMLRLGCRRGATKRRLRALEGGTDGRFDRMIRILALSLALAAAVSVAGCQTPQQSNALGGAVVGGAGGALIGSAVSHGSAGGALAGGAIGAATGAMLGAAATPPGPYPGPPPGPYYGGPPPRQCAQWAYDYNGNRVCTAFY